MENKSHNLTFCSSFSPCLFTILLKLKVPFRHVTSYFWVHGMVSVYLMRSPVDIFQLTWILVKFMPKKTLCAIRQNTIILLRFNNSDRNVFVNTDEGNLFFFLIIFLIMLLRQVQLDWKFQRALKFKNWNIISFILKHIFMYSTNFIQVAQVPLSTDMDKLLNSKNATNCQLCETKSSPKYKCFRVWVSSKNSYQQKLFSLKYI